LTPLSDIKSPLVSIIIVNFNGHEVIENCLNSVLNTNSTKFEVIVVDNGSTDSSIKFLQNFADKSSVRVKLIKNPKNLGFAEGNNLGIGNSSGKYIAFLNNDTIVDPNWLQSIVTFLEKDKQTGAVQSLLLAEDGFKVDSLGGVIDIFGTAEDRVVSMGNLRTPHSEIEEIFSACAASMVVRKSVLEEVGNFDPKFFAYYEDVDLCWRIRLRGYAIVLDLNSVVYHIRYATSKKFGGQLFNFHLYKNQLAMLIKNYELKSLVKVMPGLLLLYTFRIINGLIKNNANLSIAALKALYWNLKEFPYLSQERRYIQTYVRRICDEQIQKMMDKKPKHLSLHRGVAFHKLSYYLRLRS